VKTEGSVFSEIGKRGSGKGWAQRKREEPKLRQKELTMA